MYFFHFVICDLYLHFIFFMMCDLVFIFLMVEITKLLNGDTRVKTKHDGHQRECCSAIDYYFEMHHETVHKRFLVLFLKKNIY